MTRRGRTSKTSCQAEEARHRKSHVVRPHSQKLPSTGKPTETERRLAGAGAGGRGGQGVRASGYGILKRRDDNVWKLDTGGDGTIL